MNKTAVVEVERKRHHPRYRKLVKTHKKYKAHDELGAKVGDQVVIQESRPISKTKHWRVVKIQ
jgi:small subunit ribosomal protein S17